MRKFFDHFLKLSDVLNSALPLYKFFRELHLKCNILSLFFFSFLYKTGNMCEHLYLCVRTVNLHMVANKGESNSWCKSFKMEFIIRM